MGNGSFSPTDASIQGADSLLRAGIAAACSGERERARDLLIRALKRDHQNVHAWLWLSGVVDRPEQQRECLRQVLALDPGNQAARRGLAWLEGKAEGPLCEFAEPATAPGPRRLQANEPDAVVPQRRLLIRAAAWGALAGAALLTIALLVIRPSFVSYIAGWMFPPPVLAPSTTVDGVTATPTLPDETSPFDTDPVAHAQAVTSTATSSARGAQNPDLAPTPTDVPTVSPSATPPPTVTPAPVVYPPTRIVIPAVGVDAPIVLARSQVTDTGGIAHLIWEVPEASAAGWHEGSAPLGAIGNTIINGHNWPQDAVFRNLHLLQVGEQLILYSHNIPFFYEVAEVLVIHDAGQPWEVRQENARYIQATDDERVTLFTCYPYGSIQNRLIVIARPLEAVAIAEDE